MGDEHKCKEMNTNRGLERNVTFKKETSRNFLLGVDGEALEVEVGVLCVDVVLLVETGGAVWEAVLCGQ